MILMMAVLNPTQEGRRAQGREGNTSEWLIRLITWQEFLFSYPPIFFSFPSILWLRGRGSVKQHEATLEAGDHIAWQDNTKDKRAERLFVNPTGRQLGRCVFSFSQEGKQNWQAPLAFKQRVVQFCLNADGLAETYENKRQVIFCVFFFFSWKAMATIFVTGGSASAWQLHRSVPSHNSCCSSSNASSGNVVFTYTWMLCRVMSSKTPPWKL